MNFHAKINISTIGTFILLSCILSLNTYGQSSKNVLSYEWKIEKEGNAPHQISTTLLLINRGGITINHTDWGIYFNSIKTPKLKPASSLMYDLKHVNGDLHYLHPNKNFKSFTKGTTHEIEFLVPNIRNYTELPSGFYVVEKNKPEKGLPLTDLNKKTDTVELHIAKKTFTKNSKITDIAEDQLIKVFPSPVNYLEKSGFFEINALTKINTAAIFKGEAQLLQQDLGKLLTKGIAVNSLTVQGTSPVENGIMLIKNESLGKAYQLEISARSIQISSGEASGIFYGIQSLKTLLPPAAYAAKRATVKVKAVSILDSARFGHRALLVDVARNFLPKSEIMKTLDLMGLYKLNVLHFHLNDDEGWRLEIPGLPELTTVASKRGYTPDGEGMLPPSYGSGPDVNNPAGTGYYSSNDFKEILRYATARHIKVIPEIETPGHARAAIKAMEARYAKFIAVGDVEKANEYLLSDHEDQSVYRSVQGWKDNVINIANPSSYRFLAKVIDEIVSLYKASGAPLETIHMGGDEVPAGVWTKSPVIGKLMKEDTSLRDTNDLWRFYFKKVNALLKARNLYLYGWEEVDLKHAYNQQGKKMLVVDSALQGLNYQVDVWNNIVGTGLEDLAYKLANRDFKVVLSSVTNLYLDMAYNSSFHEPGMNWAGFVDTDKPFSFIPFDYYKSITENEMGVRVSQDFFKDKERLKDSAKQNIVGLQTALWTETLTDTLKFEYLLLPKLLGYAERAWSKSPDWASAPIPTLDQPDYDKAWSMFVNVVGKRELPRLDHYHSGYAYRVPEPGISEKNGSIIANCQFPGMTIRYTTDGSSPDKNSRIYTGPILKKGKISLKVFNKKGNSGKTVVIH